MVAGLRTIFDRKCEVDKPAKTLSENKRSGAEEIFLGGESEKKGLFTL